MHRQTTGLPENSLDLLFFFFFVNNFIYLFLAVLGLHYLLRFFSSCGNGGYSLVAVLRLLLLWSTDSWVQGLSRCGSQTLGCEGSIVWRMGLVALKHVGPSQTADQTCDSTDRWILYH